MRLLVALAAVSLAAAGCVERTIEVRTDPPGSRVWVDGRFAGLSPVSIPYTHYGVREVTAEAGRSGTARAVVALNPPIYQVFPLDFVTDCLLPVPLSWTKVVDLAVLPSPERSAASKRAEREKLLAEASGLRSRANR